MTVVSQALISTICPIPTCPPNSTVVSPISTIAISPQDDNYRIVGMQDGQVWATSTGSSTLVNITSGSFPSNPNGSPTNKFVGRAVIDPNNKNVAYIAFSFFAPAGQGVWKITNLGAAAGSCAGGAGLDGGGQWHSQHSHQRAWQSIPRTQTASSGKLISGVYNLDGRRRNLGTVRHWSAAFSGL